jgi:Zn finger protein HypA/HybF involved in hydrogenase expression
MTARALAWHDMVPVERVARCEKCLRPVELLCSGLGGTVMYETFNDYLCPLCGGHNYARTPGNIVSAHAPNQVA